jgi:hypothetical protein
MNPTLERNRQNDMQRWAWWLDAEWPVVRIDLPVRGFVLMTARLSGLKMSPRTCECSTKAMPQLRWLFAALPTASAWIRSQVRLCGLCCGRNGTGAGFLWVLRFPLPVIIPENAGRRGSLVAQCTKQVGSVSPHPMNYNLEEILLNYVRSEETVAWYIRYSISLFGFPRLGNLE